MGIFLIVKRPHSMLWVLIKNLQSETTILITCNIGGLLLNLDLYLLLKDAIAGALLANNLLKAMKEKTKDTELANNMKEHIK